MRTEEQKQHVIDVVNEYKSKDHSYDERYEAKHQCMLKNNVKILKTTDYMKYIDYVKSKYGKDI